MRKSFSRKDRERILVANGSLCHLCGGLIDGFFEVEHVIPYALTQDDSDGNLRPSHKKCHARKTHEQDRPRISKAERQRAKHLGLWPPSQAKLQGRPFASSRRQP